MVKDYNISKTTGACADCRKDLAPGEEFVAIVREGPDELLRADYCRDCWGERPHDEQADVLGVWRSRVPQPQEKRKLFVDNELLINFFERLDGAEGSAKLCFRYVLALVLMRKKLLVYDRTDRGDDGTEIWRMHFKGSEEVHRVIDPKMDEEKIAQVARQLGQILDGEL